MWITLDQIEYLQEVARTGSITKAADKLLRSKSAVAKAIQNLEEQVGFEIIDRADYRAKLTEKGKAFLFHAQSVLISVHDLKEVCAQINSQVEARLAIGVSGAFDAKRLYPIIREASKLFPSTQIVLHRETLSGEKMLFNEMVEIAIFEGIHNQRDLDFKVIGELEFKLVIAGGHPFWSLKKGQRTLKDLYKYPQIVQRSTLATEDVSYGVHKEALKWYVNDLQAKKETIVNGMGWGRLPKHEIEKELKNGALAHLKEFKDDDTINVYMAKIKGHSLGKVGQFIWEHLS